MLLHWAAHQLSSSQTEPERQEQAVHTAHTAASEPGNRPLVKQNQTINYKTTTQTEISAS